MKNSSLHEQDRRIGCALAFIRSRDCNQTQSQFAKRFRISRALLAAIESGRMPLRVALGWQICRALNIHPTFLCHGGNFHRPNVFPLTEPDEIERVEKIILANKKGLLHEVWPAIGGILAGHPDFFDKNPFDKIRELQYKENMQQQLPKLIERLQNATKERGQRAELAREFKISPQQVNDWLHGRMEPSGEYTLRLLQWVEQQERQQ